MSARVKADIMISRHVGPDGRLLIVRLADPSTQVLPLIGLWTVTLGSKQSFAAAIPKVCFADKPDIVYDERMAASLSWPTL
jgi:hypothetical protein